MAGNKKIRWVTPRRLAGAGCLVGVALVAAFVFVLYQQVRNLFSPSFQRPGGDMIATQDVAVERGSLMDGVRVYGEVRPVREAELGFRLARGKVVDVPVQPGQPVEAGQVLVQLDTVALEADLATAKGDLLDAREKLEALGITSIDTQRLKLEVELRDAQAALDKAQRELAAFDAGKGTPADRRAKAVAEVEAARTALAALRDSKSRKNQIEELRVIADLAAIEHGPMLGVVNPNEWERDMEWKVRIDMLNKQEAHQSAILSYEMDIRAAEQRVAEAERALATIELEIAAGSPQAERAKLAAAVRAADAAVQMARAKLAALGEGQLDVEVAKAQAEVLKLEGKVADAEAALAEAALVAPFAGTVEQVTAMPDTMITGSTAVVTLLDLSSVKIVARVSDIDVVRLEAGKEVRISFDALPGQELTGRLGEIPLHGKFEGGQSWFDVLVEFEGTLPELRAGMSANLFVPLERKDDVLLIPAAAVRYDGQSNYVLLVQGSKVEQRKVTLGTSDGVNVEVLQGLEEGDVVRMPLTSPMSPRGIYY